MSVTDTLKANLLETEKIERTAEHNVKVLFDVTEDMSPACRRSVDNFLVGWFAACTPSAQWDEAMKYAVKAAKRSHGEEA